MKPRCVMLVDTNFSAILLLLALRRMGFSVAGHRHALHQQVCSCPFRTEREHGLRFDRRGEECAFHLPGAYRYGH